MQNCLIPILIFTPMIMAAVILFPLLKDNEKTIRRLTKTFSVLHFIYIIFLTILFDFSNPLTSIENNIKFLNSDWMESIGISAVFSIDALSMLLIILTSVIFLTAIFLSKNMIKKSYQLYYAMLLILESAIFGIFCAKDMFLFFLFWELELIPMYILLLKWGSGNKEKTAAKFIIYTFFGSIFIFFGFLILYLFNFINNGIFNADFYNLDISNMNEKLKSILFIFFFIGFGVKLPILPFHSWLPDAHSQASTPVSIILSSVLLKIGAYGILRFNAGLFNDTFCTFAPLIMLLALINIVYASVCAINQKDIKRIIAYSGIANMGIFLLAICSLNETGFTGGIFQLFSHAFISAGLFTIAGIIFIKCGTRNLRRIKGLGNKMPAFMFASVPIILAAAGAPLLSGFIGEFLSFSGAFLSQNTGILNPQIISIAAIFSIILSSVYIMKLFHGIFFDELTKRLNQIKDINIHHKVILTVLILFIVYLGICPSVLTNIISEYSVITYNLAGGC